MLFSRLDCYCSFYDSTLAARAAFKGDYCTLLEHLLGIFGWHVECASGVGQVICCGGCYENHRTCIYDRWQVMQSAGQLSWVLPGGVQEMIGGCIYSCKRTKLGASEVLGLLEEEAL